MYLLCFILLFLQFSDSIDKDEKYPCIKFLNDLFKDDNINISQDELLRMYPDTNE